MRRRVLLFGLGLACAAGLFVLCLAVVFRVVRPGHIKLAIREVSVGRIHPGINSKSLSVSPNSRRVAYAAGRGDKWLVVLDGVEEEECEDIVKGSRLVFDSPRQLHALAVRGDEFLRDEIDIVASEAGARR